MPFGNDPRQLKRIAVVVMGVPLLLSLLVAWFEWTAKGAALPHGLPIVVVDQQVAEAPYLPEDLIDTFNAAPDGAFSVRTVPTIEAAEQALRDRTAYGALSITPKGVSITVASGGSPGVARFLRETVSLSFGGNGASVLTHDVAPGTRGDPGGGGFASGFAPLVLASMLAGVLTVMLIRSWAFRLIGLVIFSVVAGLGGAAVLHGLDIIAGSYLLTAAAIALLAAAVGAAVAGLGAVLGAPGLGLGVLIVFLFGNPISAVSLTPQFVPQPWGAIGQYLPPGAGASLLRSVSFFEGGGSTRPLIVLGSWAVVGLALMMVGRTAPGRAAAPTTAPTAAPASNA